MAINLTKNERISLTKDVPGLKNVMVGLGWDPVATITEEVIVHKKKGMLGKLFGGGNQETETRYVQKKGPKIDCDAFAVLLTGKHQSIMEDTVYFSNLNHRSGAVKHSGDNLTGDGDGDDERITINLERLPEQYQKIVIGVNIFSALSRNQSFGQIENAFIRLVNMDTNEEICRYNLSKSSEYNEAIAMLMGKLVRTHSGWDFIALGRPSMAKSIPEIAGQLVEVK